MEIQQKLMKKALEGAKSVGAETEFVSLGNKKILLCEGCYECLKKGECILNDDLNEIRRKMIESDGLIIGSPTYNRDITAQMKTFFDRLWYDIHRQTFLGKYAICANTYVITPGCGQRTLKDLTMALGYNITGVAYAKLWKFKNEIEKDSKTMKKAFNIGRKLVEDIKSQKKYLKQGLIRNFFMKPVFKKIDKLMKEKGLL